MINRELINPRSIVVIGGSNNLSTPGGKILKNIIDGGYGGDLLVVNPKSGSVGVSSSSTGTLANVSNSANNSTQSKDAVNSAGTQNSTTEMIQGVPSFKTVNELPSVELAIIAVSVKFIKETVLVLAQKKNTKAFIILSAGLSEMGEEGRRIEREIVEIIESVQGALIGPNCIGVLNTNYAGIFAGPIPKLDPKGCDFVSGSGATATFTIEKGITMGLTFSSLFSVGNCAQIGVEEVIKYWDESFDPETSSRIKLIYMENIQRPDLLLKHASSLIRKGCKIAAVKAGRSEIGERAASSHTGALANSEVAVGALLRKAGIVRCYGRTELVTTAAIFMHEMIHKLKGNNFAIITHAGGPGVLLSDVLTADKKVVSSKHDSSKEDKDILYPNTEGNINLPLIAGPEANKLLAELFPGSTVQNPIDFLATGTTEQLEKIIDFIENKNSQISGMIIIFGHTGLGSARLPYELIDRKMKECQKPIWVIMPSITSGIEDIEHFKSLSGGRVFFDDEVLFGQSLVRIMNTPLPAENVKIETENIRENFRGNAALESFNYDRASSKIRDIIEGTNLQDRNGSGEDGYLPPAKVAALLDAIGISRVKEEVVTSVPAAVSAYARLTEINKLIVMKVVGPVHKTEVGGVVLNVGSSEQVQSEYQRLMSINGAQAVLMQPMLSGTELFLGAKYEKNFGQLILCGLGGILVEVLRDTAAGLIPLREEEALQMIRSLKGYKLIEGVRGRPGVNEKLWVQMMVRLSLLLEVAPEIIEMDLNPLLGSPEQVVAVDARIRIAKK